MPTVQAALSVLADSAAGVELRPLPSAKSAVMAGSDLVGLAHQADLFCRDGQQVYYGLNPVPATFGRAAKDADVLARRWLLFDIDPIKAEGAKDLSATASEKEEARKLAEALRDHLTDQGWPAPVLVDSGNGFHLLYRLDLPNTASVRAALKKLLYGMAARFNTIGASIDKTVYNASRIAKLPGTFARKGIHTEERPHRPVLLLHAPEMVGIVTLEQIQAAAEGDAAEEKSDEQPPHEKNGKPFVLRAQDHDLLRAYAKAALEGEVGRIMLAKEGPDEGRNNALNEAAFRMGTIVGAGWIMRQEVEQKLLFAASVRGLTDQESQRTLQSGMEAGIKEPRAVPKQVREKISAEAKKDPEVKPDQVVIVRASEVKPRKVEWLWPGRIPLGKLTTFAGVGGLGKTFVLCDITARVTRGADWPDSAGECTERGSVLFISGEDDPDDTLVPRMIEQNTALERVAFLKADVQGNFTLAALKVLTAAIGQLGADTRLVVIDPPTSYLGDVNDHKNSELRGLLTPLQAWASAKRVALVFNTHVNKQVGKVEALMRVMGSVAWVNAVRAAHMFARDPEDPERRLFIPMKMNLAKERKGLAYKVTALPNELAKVEWLGEVDLTADQAVNREPGKPRRVVAAEWLIERFREKLEWTSEELFSTGRNHNVSKNAIYEAKETLKLPKARKTALENGDVVWMWWVPPDWPQLSQPKTTETVETVGRVDEELF